MIFCATQGANRLVQTEFIKPCPLKKRRGLVINLLGPLYPDIEFSLLILTFCSSLLCTGDKDVEMDNMPTYGDEFILHSNLRARVLHLPLSQAQSGFNQMSCHPNLSIRKQKLLFVPEHVRTKVY
eukprot:4902522-Amphidinium_carterae.1